MSSPEKGGGNTDVKTASSGDDLNAQKPNVNNNTSDLTKQDGDVNETNVNRKGTIALVSEKQRKYTPEELKKRREEFKKYLLKHWVSTEEANDSQMVLGLSEPYAKIQLVLPNQIQAEKRNWKFEFPARYTVDSIKVTFFFLPIFIFFP